MRKWVIGAGIAVGAVALVLGGAVYAASSATRVAALRQEASAAFGFMGGRLGPRDSVGRAGFRGQLHDYMTQAIAEQLGLPVDDLESRLAAGESLSQIAEAQGVPQNEQPAALQEAWSSALQAAVGDGVLTQEQADWMQSHPGLMMLGARGGLRGMRGGGGQTGPMGRGFPGRW